MTFAEPVWLLGLLAVPALFALEALATRRDRERLGRLVSRALWGRVVRRPPEVWRWVRLVLLALGMVGVVLALARPRWGIVREKVEREGVDVVLVLDTSGSMATGDVAPNRFVLARTALMNLVGQLPDDRLALVAFEGEAYPLVPLTLDADAVLLFLDTLEPGFVPTPGSSLGAGLAEGLELFVDKDREHKVMVLVSDGEDLAGAVDAAVEHAKRAGVVIHTVAVGTEKGAPVPSFDDQGRPAGFKKDEQGQVVVSRLDTRSLEAIARGTGGSLHRVTPVNTSLADVAAAIEGMQARTLAREYSYRKKERFQVPLGLGLAALVAGLLLPLPPRRRDARDADRSARARAVASALLVGAVLVPSTASAADGKVIDELLLRPRRWSAQGRAHYDEGNHPAAVEAFERALAVRPEDPRARFDLADALYKSGKYDEAAEQFRQLAAPGAPLAGPARYNLGNALYQNKDYPGAVAAYRDALKALPGDEAARRNLELALRRIEEQQKQDQKDEKDGDEKDDQDQKQGQNQDAPDPGGQQQEPGEPKPDATPQASGQPTPQPTPASPEQKERERFEKEAGMPKERAMQLLDALQQNEKDEQKKALAAQRQAATGKDW